MATLTTDVAAPETAPARYRWTRQQYEQMVEAGVLGSDDRVELINGEIVTMSPQGSRHYTLLHMLTERLRKAYPEAFYVRSQAPLALGTESEPEPDIAVVEGSPRDYMDEHPRSAVLVVEVADASLLKDRGPKTSLYARHGIPEYWILNVEDACLEVYRDPARGTYREKTTLAAGATVTPPQASEAIAIVDIIP